MFQRYILRPTQITEHTTNILRDLKYNLNLNGLPAVMLLYSEYYNFFGFTIVYYDSNILDNTNRNIPTEYTKLYFIKNFTSNSKILLENKFLNNELDPGSCIDLEHIVKTIFPFNDLSMEFLEYRKELKCCLTINDYYSVVFTKLTSNYIDYSSRLPFVSMFDIEDGFKSFLKIILNNFKNCLELNKLTDNNTDMLRKLICNFKYKTEIDLNTFVSKNAEFSIPTFFNKLDSNKFYYYYTQETDAMREKSVTLMDTLHTLKTFGDKFKNNILKISINGIVVNMNNKYRGVYIKYPGQTRHFMLKEYVTSDQEHSTAFAFTCYLHSLDLFDNFMNKLSTLIIKYM
jgi:hypothetical protein